MKQCTNCRGWMLDDDYRREVCFDCSEAATEDGELESSSIIRCPACRFVFDPNGSEYENEDGF